MKDLERLIGRAESALARLELMLPAPPPDTDWGASIAFRWCRRESRSWIEPIRQVHRIGLDDLRGIDVQKKVVEQNTRQFVAGLPANNVLLTGARGTGKSSIVKGLLNKYARQGLRLIEVEKNDLVDLPHIVDQVAPRKERFLLFCDDLSFHGAEDKVECGALPAPGAFGPDGAVHHFSQAPADDQPQPGASIFARGGGIDLVERLE